MNIPLFDKYVLSLGGQGYSAASPNRHKKIWKYQTEKIWLGGVREIKTVHVGGLKERKKTIEGHSSFAYNVLHFVLCIATVMKICFLSTTT